MNSVTVSELQSDIALVTLDTPGSSANVLTEELFAEMDSTFESLQQRTDLAGLILCSAKPKIFIAGADLKRIWRTLDWPDEKIIEFCEEGRRIMARLSQMPCPTVAAIHGACVGGGLEVALWCDFRIATDDRRTILGLPEVKLGLVPGWAGTVRLPRLTCLENALELVVTGEPINALEAKEMGLIDAVSKGDKLIDDAAKLVQRVSNSDKYLRRRSSMRGPVADIPGGSDLAELKEAYHQSITENLDVYHEAPTVVLEHMIETAGKSHDEACLGESLAMAKVYGSDASYGLLNCFFLGEHNRKNPGQVDTSLETKSISNIGIVGAGLMGRSIAEICLDSGLAVYLYDASQSVLADAISEFENVPIHEVLGYQDFQDCDLIIESVVENEEIKRSVLAEIERSVDPELIIATNTSAIPLSKLSTQLKHSNRFCGVHFCHPQLMALVEIVGGDSTDPHTVASAVAWIRSLGKIPVAVSDGPGFVVNRLLAAMLDQSIRLYGWGYSIEVIDQSVRDFGFRGGPFEIVDIIGVETCMYAGREMLEGNVHCVTLSPVLPRMVKKGWLGRKSGRGFYQYDRLDGPRKFDPEIDSLLKPYVDIGQRPELTADEIAQSIMSVIILEASFILDQRRVNDYRDIDICTIYGFSFPAHRGGILFWADRVGIASVNATLQQMARYDKKLEPSERMLAMERDGLTFYPSAAAVPSI